MTFVIDSSVVLASMLGERGGEMLTASGGVFHLSIVNLAEVHTKVVDKGGRIEDVNTFLSSLPLRVRSFRVKQAESVGRLRPLTRHRGLSLGDRACLALALSLDLPVLTAEHKWADLDIGVDIRLIRERR